MLFYKTVDSELRYCLHRVMAARVFEKFRLVGGTALSLQIGHRVSIDIDLFTDAEYGSIDFRDIDNHVEKEFPYVSHLEGIPAAFGKSYFIGRKPEASIKLDVFYTDPFINQARVEDGIRMATLTEIASMKMDVVQRTGRKKDFWDIHELLKHFSMSQLMELHERRYSYSHDPKVLLSNFANFEKADDDIEPVCLIGKYWPFIKEDLVYVLNSYKESRK